jgi:sporulation protein YlmC with PRC-barrel domain
MELDADQFLDAVVYDVQGQSIGTVSDVYVDDDTGRPEWLLISTGFLPRGSHVPIRDVERHEDGYRLPYTRDRVKSAPELDITTEELSEEDERVLYVYYGIPTEETPSGADASAGRGAGEGMESPPGARDESEAA